MDNSWSQAELIDEEREREYQSEMAKIICSDFLGKCSASTHVFLYGAGHFGQVMARFLKKKNINKERKFNTPKNKK